MLEAMWSHSNILPNIQVASRPYSTSNIKKERFTKWKDQLVCSRSVHFHYIQGHNKLRCCEFKGKQASKIESTSLYCISYTVLHVRDQKNEWSVFVE